MANNSRKYSGCLNCPDRKVTEDYNCHSDCQRYADFKEQLDQTREAEQQRHRMYPRKSQSYLKKVGRRNNEC